VSSLIYGQKQATESLDVSSISIFNIFGQKLTIPYKSIEIISFEFETAFIQRKKDTSFFSKFGYKIQKRIKPQKIIYLNKL